MELYNASVCENPAIWYSISYYTPLSMTKVIE